MKPQEIINANIIEVLGLGSLPEEQKIAMLEKMSTLVQKRVMLKIMESIGSEDADKMAELEKNPQEMLAFIAEKVPNFEAIVTEEIVKLKQEVMKAAEQV